MKTFLLGLILLSIGATFYVVSGRVGWELAYRTVTVALDYEDLGTLAAGGTDAALAELAALGVTAIVLDPAEAGEEELARIRRYGLEPVFLLRDLYRYDLSSLDGWLLELARLEPRLVLFADNTDKVNYTPEQLAAIAKALQVKAGSWSEPALVGVLEFAPAPEASALYRQGFLGFVRAHRIEPEELGQLDLEEALARFRRAVRERNIRLIWVHLFPASREYNLDYLERLTELLRGDGFRLGLAGPSGEFRVARPVLVLILLGPLALGLLGVRKVRPLGARSELLLVALGAMLIVAGLYLVGEGFRLAAAWAVAVFAPLAACLLFEGQFEGSLRGGVLAVLAFSGVALLGGLWVGTILAETPFFLKLLEFRGVKAALVLPLLGALLIHSARDRFAELKSLLLRRPTLGELALIVLGGGVVLIALLRSDNLSIIPVSGLEGRARGLLEGLLYARPRFKEFLLGHPLLLLWGAYGRRLREYGPILLALGLVGQVSIVNSFAHLHTPLLLSLLRTANGLALGLILGLIAWALVRWGERLWQSGS
jgi:hypothetical protein